MTLLMRDQENQEIGEALGTAKLKLEISKPPLYLLAL